MKNFLVIFIAVFFLAIQFSYAHPPLRIDAEFDPDDQALSVKVTHLVSNTERHYIKTITVSEGNNAPDIKSFSSQTDNTSGSTVFALSGAKPEDTVTIESECSIYGKLARSYKISDITVSNNKAQYRDGSYKIENAMMYIEVIIKADKIADIRILEHRGGGPEYAHIIKPLAQKIIDKQSVDVDAVSGATISSNSLKEAVSKALEQAKF